MLPPEISAYLDSAKSIDKKKMLVLFEFQSQYGKTGLVKELIETYLAGWPSRLDAILALFKTSRFKELSDEMHGLKASAGNIGGMNLFRICDRIEGMADAEVPALQAEFHREFQAFEAELRRLYELL